MKNSCGGENPNCDLQGNSLAIEINNSNDGNIYLDIYLEKVQGIIDLENHSKRQTTSVYERYQTICQKWRTLNHDRKNRNILMYHSQIRICETYIECL